MGETPPISEQDDRALIFATLEEYAAAYCAKDLDRLMALFADGEAISLIGTGAGEMCAGREAVEAVFRRNFAEATATRFVWGWHDIVVHGDTAVVAIEVAIHLKVFQKKVRISVRWTVSLVRTDAGWKWLHRNASVAAGAQADGAAYPAD